MERPAAARENGGKDMSVLVSGGAGYIGSHACVELLQAGYEIIAADNFYNASPERCAVWSRSPARKCPLSRPT